MHRLFICGVLALSACSSDTGSGESWYDQQRSERDRRDAYVRTQAEAGVSELEAKQSWDRQIMIENTRGGARAVSVEGDELDELIGR